MLRWCESLWKERDLLFHETDHRDMKRWPTEDTYTVTRWALKLFKLVQYDWTKLNMPELLGKNSA